MARLTFRELNVARPARESPETFWNRRRQRELIGGYFYPLDARRALDAGGGMAYIEQAVSRARREPRSSRNARARARA